MADPAPKAPRERRFTVKRAEKAVGIAEQSWPEFFRGLGVLTLTVAVAVAVIVGILWLLFRR
jgi:hypothetical protein